MSHLVQVGSSTYKRIIRHARPFSDTAETIINRALDAYVSRNAKVRRKTIRIDAAEPVSLSHTQLVKVKIDGVKLDINNWNELLAQMLSRVGTYAYADDDIWEISGINVFLGKRPDDRHFRTIPKRNRYFRYVDANTAYRAVRSLARWLGYELEISLSWSASETAAHPGHQGFIFVSSESGLLQAA